jgi:hypothetical protein
VEFGKEVAEKVGLGFKLPATKVDVEPNGPRRQMSSWFYVLECYTWFLRAPVAQLDGASGATPDAHARSQFIQIVRYEIDNAPCDFSQVLRMS